MEIIGYDPILLRAGGREKGSTGVERAWLCHLKGTGPSFGGGGGGRLHELGVNEQKKQVACFAPRTCDHYRGRSCAPVIHERSPPLRIGPRNDPNLHSSTVALLIGPQSCGGATSSRHPDGRTRPSWRAYGDECRPGEAFGEILTRVIGDLGLR